MYDVLFIWVLLPVKIISLILAESVISWGENGRSPHPQKKQQQKKKTPELFPINIDTASQNKRHTESGFTLS